MMFLLSLNPAANRKGNSNRRDKGGGAESEGAGQAGESVVVVVVF